MRRFLLVELLRLALALVGADVVLQGCFAPCDYGLGAADFRFEFMDAIFHLLALDGIQPLSFGGRHCVRGLVTV